MKTSDFNPPKGIRLFILSAGTLLLVAALVLLLSAWSDTGRIHPLDPLFHLPLPIFFSIVGGFALPVALVCLFCRQFWLPITLILWLAFTFFLYATGLWWLEITGGFKGYWGMVSGTFNLTAGTTDWMFKSLAIYLFIGGSVALIALQLQRKPRSTSNLTTSHLKTSCPDCAGHIEFPDYALGQKIPCPHCETEITLTQPSP